LFTATSTQLFALALEAIEKLFQSLKPEENVANNPELFASICSIASAIITDELNQEVKQAEIFSTMMNYISVALHFQSEQALTILVSISELFPEIAKIDNKSVQTVIEAAVKFSEKLTLETNPLFVFEYMRSLIPILVTIQNIDNREVLVSVEKFLDRFISYPPESLPPDYPPQIQQFAINSKEMLSLFLSNYPFPESPEFPSSRYIKNIDQPLIILPNDTYLVPGIDGEKTSFAVQTRSGQFIWESKPVLKEIFPEEPATEVSLKECEGSLEAPTLTDNKEQKAFSVKFEEVINSFKEKYALNSPLDQINDSEENIVDLQADINGQYKKFHEEEKQRPYIKIRPPIVDEKRAASFLSCVGIITTEDADKLHHATLESESVQTLITKTLSSTHRVHAKAALVYAGNEHYDQNKIFKISIDETSPRFKEFISLLGWNIKLKDFAGYAGGLDIIDDRNGPSSIYANAYDFELMYHCCPLLACAAKDDQFVSKKKHIGNDHIQVIFVDNDQEYEALTITSQFNFVTIIVYPLQTGLYRVDVHHRPGLQWFGPLHDPTIVTKYSLSHFITTTIINAMNLLWGNTIPYSHPSLDTAKKVQQMIKEQVDKDAGKVDSFIIIQRFGKTNQDQVSIEEIMADDQANS